MCNQLIFSAGIFNLEKTVSHKLTFLITHLHPINSTSNIFCGEREGDRDRLAAVSDLALVREARSCERPQEK